MIDNRQKKKFQGDKTATLYALGFVLITIIIIIEIVALANKYRNNQNEGPSDTAAVGDNTPWPESSASAEAGTPAAEGTAAAQTAAQMSESGAETPTVNINPTATSIYPTATPYVTPTNVTPQNTPTETGIDEVAARIIEPENIDFSFLEGVSTAAFEDAAENSYDWYPGSVVRDGNGNITYKWDRYKSTLDLLEKYGGIYRKNADQNVVYLTFDCGYETGQTEKILDTLKEKNCKAIFFVTGSYVTNESNYKILRRMIDEGHLIGSHTDTHQIMPTVSNEEFVNELNNVYKKLKKVLGDDVTMLYYRPPQGASCERDLALAQYLGYHSVFWSGSYADYNIQNQPDPEAALKLLKSKLHPGCVYLLHAESSTNASILGDYIDFIRSEGYEIRRIDE